MKAKMMIVTLFVVFCMVLTIPGTASAGFKWRECTVVTAGPDTTGDDTTLGYVIIRLKRADGKEKNFVVKDGEENRVLAVALTAMAAGMKVIAGVDWSYAMGDYIDGIYLMSSP
jgi:hypothetical protein